MTHADPGYSVKEVLDQVSGKLDSLAAQISTITASHAVVESRLSTLESAKAVGTERVWQTVLSVATGSGGLATGLAALLLHH